MGGCYITALARFLHPARDTFVLVTLQGIPVPTNDQQPFAQGLTLLTRQQIDITWWNIPIVIAHLPTQDSGSMTHTRALDSQIRLQDSVVVN